MGRFVELANAYPVSGTGLVFATPQWVQAPVRLAVVVEKMIQVGSPLGDACPPPSTTTSSGGTVVDSITSVHCVWSSLRRKGEAAGGKIPPILMNVLGSCGDVDAPEVNLMLSVFGTKRSKMLPVLALDVKSSSSAGAVEVSSLSLLESNNLVNISSSEKKWLTSVVGNGGSETVDVPSVLESTFSSPTMDFGVGTRDQLFFGASDTSGLGIVFSLVANLFTADSSTNEMLFLFPSAAAYPTGSAAANPAGAVHLSSRTVSLFRPGGQDAVPKNQRCKHCDEVLDSGWNHGKWCFWKRKKK
jgi:hypothetical protein